jgi:WD40 repeat protein
VPTAVSVDPNMKYFAYGTSNGDGGFSIYDYQTLEPIYTQKDKSQILCINFSSNSKYCFVLNIDTRTLSIIDCETKTLVKSKKFDLEFSHFSVHPNNEYIVLSGGATGIQLYNWKTDASEMINLNVLTFQVEFTNDGNGIGVTSRGIDCKVLKIKILIFRTYLLLEIQTLQMINMKTIILLPIQKPI